MQPSCCIYPLHVYCESLKSALLIVACGVIPSCAPWSLSRRPLRPFGRGALTGRRAATLSGSSMAIAVKVRVGVWIDLELVVSVRVAGIDAPELFRPKCEAERRRARAAKTFVEAFVRRRKGYARRHRTRKIRRPRRRPYRGGADEILARRWWPKVSPLKAHAARGAPDRYRWRFFA